MKIQAAIDRVTEERAIELIELLSEADIVELGTSLTKDYGLAFLKDVREKFQKVKFLADIKTIDEAEYEFTKYYEAGADYLTVMGAAERESLEICYQVSRQFGKEMVIDLLGCSEEKIESISDFSEALYALHFAKDNKQEIFLSQAVNRFTKRFPQIRRKALAGSITLEKFEEIKEADLEIVIIGSAITKKDNPKEELRKFMRLLDGAVK
ncbi:MAG: orotidine 5'-phosphate decarboxylase [Streptococcaceae bacterium]|jgi:3-hexulose-6-phosphate synthase|nr:orotidine 5'-phosphate decarboxylase [Streptococcaceae bacterium]